MSTYYKECFVEQVYHYDALDEKVWENLKEGTDVFLTLDEADTKVNVKVKYKLKIDGGDKEGTLGILSAEDSESMLPFLKAKRNDVFSAKICLNSGIDSEEKRIKVVVFIKSE